MTGTNTSPAISSEYQQRPATNLASLPAIPVRTTFEFETAEYEDAEETVPMRK